MSNHNSRRCRGGGIGRHTGLKSTSVTQSPQSSRRQRTTLLTTSLCLIGLFCLGSVTVPVTTFIYIFLAIIATVITYSIVDEIRNWKGSKLTLLVTIIFAIATLLFVFTRDYPKAAFWGHGNIQAVGE